MISRNIAKTFNNLFIKNIYFRAASKSSKDLYQILGVNKNSDPKQIKKAYYKLAQQHHPDKNSSPGAKQKFAQINNAYQVLSDPQKKQMYDQTGSTESFDQGQGFSQQDIFNQFKGGFQGMNMGGMGGFQDILNEMFGGGSKKGRKNQRQASVMNMSIDFMESVNGATKTVQFTKQITCQNCNGSKCKPGTSPIKCNTCNGTGAQTIRQGMFIMNTMCNSCMGEGSKIKQFCSGCKGTGVQKKNVKQQVQIPRGISDGQTIKLSKKGNFNGDLLIKVSVRKNNKFIRDGNNVKTDLQISPIDAILGCKKQINTIYNTKAQVNIQPGSQYGQNIDILGEGFYMRGSNQKGKHIITLKIVIPKQITSEEKAIYEQLKKVQQVV